jgi:hypothetical protein
VGDRILVRFNNKAEPGSPLVWRVLVNGVESLASDLRLVGEMRSVTSHEGGVKKYNVGCLGTVTWQDTTAVITSDKTRRKIE